MQHVGSDPEAERGRGEVNLSPIQGLTLRPRVGGFYVSGKLWEAQFVVLYVSGRLWEVQFVVFYVSGRLWEIKCIVFYGLEAPNGDKFFTFVRFWDGRLWEAKSFVFYVSGRLWEAQLLVLFTLRAVPPTHLIFISVSF